MALKWEEFLQDGSYKGVTFDFVSAREQGGNELDVQVFPGRNGARVQKRRRKELRIDVMAVFVEDNYPENMLDLLNKLSDGTPGELIHPVFGSIQASAESFTSIHDAEDPDSGMIQITFVEDTPDAEKVFTQKNTVAGKASETRANADQVNTNAAAYVEQVVSEIEEAVSLAVALGSVAYAEAVNTAELCTSAAAEASIAADTLEQDGDAMTSASIQSLVNSTLAGIDAAVLALGDYTTEQASDLETSLLAMAASLDELALALLSLKPPLITVMVEATIPLLAYAHAVYGDSSRAEELLLLNDLDDPLVIPVGTLMRQYAF